MYLEISKECHTLGFLLYFIQACQVTVGWPQIYYVKFTEHPNSYYTKYYNYYTYAILYLCLYARIHARLTNLQINILIMTVNIRTSIKCITMHSEKSLNYQIINEINGNSWLIFPRYKPAASGHVDTPKLNIP